MKKQPIDPGTPELARHHAVVYVAHGKFQRHVKVLDQCEIDRLYLRNRLTQAQHHALERVVGDMHKARMLGPRIGSYGVKVSTGDPSPITMTVVNARRRLTRGLRLVTKRMGRNAAIMVVRVCQDEMQTTKEIAEMLAHAADILARVYDR